MPARFLSDTLPYLLVFSGVLSLNRKCSFIGNYQCEKYNLSSSFCKIFLQPHLIYNGRYLMFNRKNPSSFDCHQNPLSLEWEIFKIVIGNYQWKKYKLSSSFCKKNLQPCGLKRGYVFKHLSRILRQYNGLNKTLMFHP